MKKFIKTRKDITEEERSSLLKDLKEEEKKQQIGTIFRCYECGGTLTQHLNWIKDKERVEWQYICSICKKLAFIETRKDYFVELLLNGTIPKVTQPDEKSGESRGIAEITWEQKEGDIEYVWEEGDIE